MQLVKLGRCIYKKQTNVLVFIVSILFVRYNKDKRMFAK